MTQHDVLLTLRMAKEFFPDTNPRLISDNGFLFIAKEFNSFIADREIAHFRTSVNYPQSNGKIERFHRSIAEECLRLKSALSISELRNILQRYIHYYNTERLHAAINYLTPADYISGLTKQKLDVRLQKLADATLKREANCNSFAQTRVPPCFFVPDFSIFAIKSVKNKIPDTAVNCNQLREPFRPS